MLASYIIHVWEDDKKSSIVKNRLFRNMRDGHDQLYLKVATLY